MSQLQESGKFTKQNNGTLSKRLIDELDSLNALLNETKEQWKSKHHISTCPHCRRIVAVTKIQPYAVLSCGHGKFGRAINHISETKIFTFDSLEECQQPNCLRSSKVVKVRLLVRRSCGHSTFERGPSRYFNPFQ